MKKVALFAIALLASVASVSSSPRQKVESRKYLMVSAAPGSNAENVATAAKSVGVLMGREHGDPRYRIVVKSGLTHAEAIARLKKSPAIAQVQIALPPQSFANDWSSVKGVGRQLAALKERRAAEEGDKKPEGAEEGEGFSRWDARKFYLEQRAYPNDTIDVSAYHRATKHRDAMPPTRFDTGGGGAKIETLATEARWESIGPKNLGVPNIFTGPAPLSGRVNAIAYHPQTPTTFYVGSSSGGLWKTTDNGTTFAPMGDYWSSIFVSSIAVAPNNGNIVYVGTGDFNGYTQVVGPGLMKSSDGGNTWIQLGLAQDFHQYSISDILIDPGNANNITVTLGRGRFINGTIYRSLDGGATWTQVLNVPAEWSDLAVSAAVGSTRYYYAVSCEGLLYRSSDRGATWAPIANPLIAGGFALNRISCPPSNGNIAYMVDGNAEQVFKTGNAGGSWSNITGAFPWDIGFGAGFTNWDQSWYDTFITVGRQGANDIVWVGLIDLVRSSNSGGTWVRAGQVYNTSAKIHPDQHCLVLHPTNAQEGLLGCDGGVYRFTYDAGTNTFTTTPLNLNLGTTEFYKFDIHPSNPDIVIGGTQDNSTPYSKNGDLNNWINVVGGDGGFAAIDPTTPANQYGSSQFLNIRRTDDDWLSSSGIGPSMSGESPAFIAPLVLDPNDPDLLYAGSNFLHRYERSTGTWDMQLGAQNFNTSILAVAVAPGDSNRIYVGTTGSELWMTQNAGLTWTQIDTGSPSIPNRSITSISVRPGAINDVLVGVSGTGGGHVYRCTNVLAGTRVWTNVSGAGSTGLPDIPLNAIARDVDLPDISWHVATDVGVFTTFDGGATWTNSTAPLGLPNVRANDLRVRASDRTLYVATYGRGIWRMAMPVARNAVSALSVAPNVLSGGSNTTGTVTLAGPAGVGGDIVSIASTDPKTCIVPATVTVPEGLTSVNFVIQCVNNTNASRSVTITAARPGSGQGFAVTVKPSNYAQYISQSVPAAMVAGQTYTVNMVYKNVGGTTWSLPLGYKVQSRNPPNNMTWGFNRIPVSGTVLPGANGTFNAKAIAPTTGGTYNFQWQMIHEGIANFGPQTPNVAVVVTVAADAARFISQTGVPTTINAGHDFTPTITMRNVGTNTWPAGTQYQLRTRNPIDNLFWGSNRIDTPASTAQGVNAAFTKTFTAPLTAGTYSFNWSMNKSGLGTFGDLTQNVPIVVTNGANNAQFNSQSGVPVSIPRNTAFSATITMTNIGTGTWASGGPINLRSTSATTWGVAQILPTANVAPSTNHSFVGNFTSPATPGVYAFEFRMHNGTIFFGQRSTIVMVNVT